jgi:lysophospholipase L1-like esterase
MKLIPLAFSALVIFIAAPLRADLVLQAGDHVAICGDSITEQRRYSVFMEDYFLMCQPVAGLSATQFGWSGEKAGGFLARLDSDVLPFKPTVATTCYGMNDGTYAAMTPAIGDIYRRDMTASVEKLKAGGVRAIVVGSPGCVDAAAFFKGGTTAEVYNKTLDALRGIAQEVAQKEGVGFADVFTPMMEVNAKAKAAYGEKYQLVAGGGVHPNNNGHIVMAYALLKGLGCDGAIGTITVDLAADTAEGTPGQKIVSCKKGTVTVESTRYPFCFQGDPNTGDQNEACVLKFFPFNDDLNRYLLVVKELKGAKAKVTWGAVTKEFATADLAKGINLAAEFLVNPFSQQFARVNAAVLAQQVFETPLVKTYMHTVPSFKTMMPGDAADLDKVSADGMAQAKKLGDAAAALVVPVQHTITIEEESPAAP